MLFKILNLFGLDIPAKIEAAKVELERRVTFHRFSPAEAAFIAFAKNLERSIIAGVSISRN
jgi:hypothetical protein